MSRNVSTEFNCRRTSVMFNRSDDKLAVNSLISLVCRLSLIPPKREKECMANCFSSKICEFVSGKLSKCLCFHSDKYPITSIVAN